MATRKRYAARLRALDDGGNETGPELLHIIFPLGVLPAPGDKYWPLYSGGDAITAEQLGAMGLDCTGTGIFVPPATVTYTTGRQYGLRPVASAPTILVLAPRYEKPRGVVIVLNATGGNPAVRLVPQEGQAFTDTGRKQAALESGTPPNPAQYYLDYASAPAGLYRVDAWPSGVAESGPYVSETVRVPAGANRAPVIVNQYPDQEALVSGDKVLAPVSGTFSDPDGGTLTYTAAALDGAGNPTTSLPAGLTFTATAANPFTVTAAMANMTVVIRLIATNSQGQSTPCDWLLTVNRKTLTGLVLNIPGMLDEGKGFQATTTASFSDNSTVNLNLQQDAKLYLAGPDGVFKPAFAEIAGVKLGVNGLTTADANTTTGDSRSMQMRVEYGGQSDTKSFLVNDKTTAIVRRILSIDFEYVTQNGSSYLLWYITTNFGIDGLQMAISWPTDPTYGAQAPGQWLMSPSASDPTYRILRDAPVAITAHFRDVNSGTPEISFTVNRPANIRGNAARVNVYTA